MSNLFLIVEMQTREAIFYKIYCGKNSSRHKAPNEFFFPKGVRMFIVDDYGIKYYRKTLSYLASNNRMLFGTLELIPSSYDFDRILNMLSIEGESLPIEAHLVLNAMNFSGTYDKLFAIEKEGSYSEELEEALLEFA